MKARVERALARLTDPRQRLELMLRHDMKDEAYALISELVKTQTAFFTRSYAAQHGAFFEGQRNRDSGFANVTLVIHNEEPFDDLQAIENRVRVNMSGFMCERSSKFRFKDLVEAVVNCTISAGPRADYSTMLGTIDIVRFLCPNAKFRHDVELFAMRLTLLREDISKLDSFDPDYKITGIKEDRREVLNRHVDRWESLGGSKEELRELLLERLRRNMWHPSTWISVACAKCFELVDPDLRVALMAVRERVWRDASHEGPVPWQMTVFQVLSKRGGWKASSQIDPTNHPERTFGSELIRILSEGRAAWVFQFLKLFGKQLRLVNVRTGMNGNRLDDVDEVMQIMAPQAFVMACNKERWGIAAALAQAFDVVNDPAFLRAANDLVRERADDLIGYTSEDDELAHCCEHGLFEDEEDLEDEERRTRHEDMLALATERNGKLAELKDERSKQVQETIDMALTLEQPITLKHDEFIQIDDFMT
ncbi:MAG: hypothetical protein ABIA47_05135 [bacterium]